MDFVIHILCRSGCFRLRDALISVVIDQILITHAATCSQAAALGLFLSRGNLYPNNSIVGPQHSVGRFEVRSADCADKTACTDVIDS
jgi:hypothetical protein